MKPKIPLSYSSAKMPTQPASVILRAVDALTTLGAGAATVLMFTPLLDLPTNGKVQGLEDRGHAVGEGSDGGAFGPVGGHGLGHGASAEADRVAGTGLAERGQAGGGHHGEDGIAGRHAAAAVQDEQFVARGYLDRADRDAAGEQFAPAD